MTRGLGVLAPVTLLGLALAALVVLGGQSSQIAVLLAATFLWSALAWRQEWPIVLPLVATGWGTTVFTTEAGLTVGQSASTFGPTKIAPLILLVGATALLLANDRARHSVRLPVAVYLFGAYLFWQLVCVGQSAHPTLSLLRVVQAAIPFGVVVVLAQRKVSPMWLVYPTLAACSAHVLYTLTAGTYVGFTGEQRLVGLLIANSFACAAGLVIVIALALWQGQLLPRRLRWLPLPLIGVATLAIDQSVGRTASIAVPSAIVIGCVFFGGTPGRSGVSSGRRLLLTLVVLFAGLYATSQAGQLVTWFSTGNQSLDTLTGRTVLWKLIGELVQRSPVFGYGPGSMRFGDPELRGTLGSLLDLGQAHNSYFEALINTGYPGAFLWLVSMFALVVRAWRIQTQFRPLVLSLVVVLSMFSITLGNMSGFGIGWYALMMTLGIACSPTSLSSPERASKRAVTLATVRGRPV
ncbi:O-antigen ligase family protein [Nocardioides sp.]|uniref:O-antigen ligase family protein n=1 Tax=Nocardioides sp. TaxID=35761 RepID=UPI0031FE6B6E|nr:O-antigen ligase-related protein [Nocardioides sp.]